MGRIRVREFRIRNRISRINGLMSVVLHEGRKGRLKRSGVDSSNMSERDNKKRQRRISNGCNRSRRDELEYDGIRKKVRKSSRTINKKIKVLGMI